MMLNFGPFTFIFFSIYMIILIFLSSISNFIIYWVFMEFLMLIFMGMSYTLLTNSFSSLMLYFMIQALSSFFLLSSYLLSSSLLMTLSFLLKLSMFPFHSWFISVSYRFPPFILWLISTLHKMPIFFMLMIFNLSLNMSLLWTSFCFSCFLSGCLMLNMVDLRMVLIVSSVGNNSWFFLSALTNLFSFLLFFAVYSITLFLLFSLLNNLSKFSSLKSNFIMFLIVSLSGLPPFPIFYTKMIILLQLLSTMEFSNFILLFLLSASLMLMGYMYSVSKFFMNHYSSKLLLFN